MPVTGLLLTLLALLGPDQALAPRATGDVSPAAVQTAAVARVAAVPPDPARPTRTASLGIEDRRTAGGALPPAPSAPPADLLPPSVASARETAHAYQQALDAARAEGSAYGISFAAVRDGELVWAGSSGRARDGRTPLEPASPMVIGSVTKTFVAAAVLQLAEEGRLSLDDAVRTHLPELRQVSPRITVRQLLDHTSGLADLFNDATRRGLEDDPGHAWTADEILETLHAPWYQPGRGWAYANTNYYLLGLIVERVSDASLADVLASRFIGPLDLEGTRLLTGSVEDPLEPAWTTIFWASGAMAAPAADLARWGDALYRDGLLSDASRQAMLAMNEHDYGLGAQKVAVGRTKGHGHTGLLNTYTTLLFHVPDQEVTIALLVNRSHVDLAAMLRAVPEDGASLLDLALGRERR